jgi:hypothetical protein
MQLRVYAMYERSRQVLVLLGVCFLLEIVASIVIVWFNFGPGSLNTAGMHLVLFVMDDRLISFHS